MIDLHIHTKYSDGDYTVTEILKKAEKLNIEVLSITDHNSVDAHLELRGINTREYFSGEVITGCEFSAAYKGMMIEVVGHKIDIDMVEEFFQDYYNDERATIKTQEVYDTLTSKLKELGITYGDIKVTDAPYTLKIYNEVIKDGNNITRLDEDVFSSFSNFMRNGLYNPKSKICAEYNRFYPSLQETIDLIHKAGGLCFLAHPMLYPFDNTEVAIEDIYSNYDLDGIECFHDTAAAINKIDFLLSFARRHELLVSGGSDFHGDNNEFHSSIGHGIHGLNINRKYFYEWNK